MRKFPLICFTLMWVLSAQNSETDKLVEGLLGDTQIEEDLQELSDVIGGRPTGSKANFLSIDWGLEKFQRAGVSASKEEFTMPGLWLENESAAEISGAVEFEPRVAALTFSTGTMGIKAELLDGGHGTADDFARLGKNAKGSFILIETDELVDLDGLFKEYADAVLIEDLAYDAGVDIFDRKEQSRIETARPADKMTIGLAYNMGNLSIALNNTRFGEVTWKHAGGDETLDYDDATDQIFSAKMLTDLNLSYQVNDMIGLNLAINNLGDVYPDEINTKGDFEADLGGRFQYPWEVNQFGFSGMTIQGGLSVQF